MRLDGKQRRTCQNDVGTENGGAEAECFTVYNLADTTVHGHSHAKRRYVPLYLSSHAHSPFPLSLARRDLSDSLVDLDALSRQRLTSRL